MVLGISVGGFHLWFAAFALNVNDAATRHIAVRSKLISHAHCASRVRGKGEA